MSPPQCGPVSVSSQSEASDKASVCQAWRRCGVVSAAIPLSQQPNSATSMVVPIASQASTIVETNNQRHVSYSIKLHDPLYRSAHGGGLSRGLPATDRRRAWDIPRRAVGGGGLIGPRPGMVCTHATARRSLLAVV